LARDTVKAIYRPGKRYLKAGIGLLELSDKAFLQADMFHRGQGIEADRLMTVLDKINKRYGQGASYLAAEGASQRWRMRQHYPSPAYTTRWQELPEIVC
jgi:DNA polymerase V